MFSARTEQQIKELARESAQFLFNEVWKLPRKVVQDATCAQLPAKVYDIPREKPLPAKPPQTRWEQFAQRKGIGKKADHDSNKVWDEESKVSKSCGWLLWFRML